jgi:hypothetical protein
MDARVSLKIEDELLARKVILIREQLTQNRIIRTNAFEELASKSFDSSSAAVKAFFEASKEERALMQIEKVIEDLSRAQTPDLQRQFRELAERAGMTEETSTNEIEDSQPLDT